MKFGNVVLLGSLGGAVFIIVGAVAQPAKQDARKAPQSDNNPQVEATSTDWPVDDVQVFADLVAGRTWALPPLTPTSLTVSHPSIEALYSRWEISEQLSADVRSFAVAESAFEIAARIALLDELAEDLSSRPDDSKGAFEFVERRARVWEAVVYCRLSRAEAKAKFGAFQYETSLAACDQHIAKIASVSSDLSKENLVPFAEDAVIENPWPELATAAVEVAQLRKVVQILHTATLNLEEAIEMEPPPKSVRGIEQWIAHWSDGPSLADVPQAHAERLKRRGRREWFSRRVDALVFTHEGATIVGQPIAGQPAVTAPPKDITKALHEAYSLRGECDYPDLRKRITGRVSDWLAAGIPARELANLHPLLKEAVGTKNSTLIVGVYEDDDEQDDIWNFWPTVEVFQENNEEQLHPTTDPDKTEGDEKARQINDPPQTPGFIALTQQYNAESAKARAPNVILSKQAWVEINDGCEALEKEAADYRVRAKEKGVFPKEYEDVYKTLSFLQPANFAKEVIQFFDNEQLEVWEND